MYNDNDEMYEVGDFDEDVEQRKALIEEAKQLEMSADVNAVFREISNLQRRWRRIPYWESAYEDTLEEEFDSYIDVFYSKRREGYQSNEAAKQDLIKQAEKAAVSEDFNKATELMNDLMNQWKAVGSAGKDTDDQLWESFNAARQKFFDRKHDHWEGLQEKFEHARIVKNELIERAAALADSEEWNKTSEEYRKMMEEWKAVGSAGREHEDTLWKKFRECRQKFYDRRNAYYDELHEVQGKKYEEKKALVEEAQTIADEKEYTREHTDRMKNLGVEWKKIGSCGKDKEDQIWKKFRSIMDAYFEGLKQWNDQKHEQWRQRMNDIRSRKQELLQNQKRQLTYMEREVNALLGQRAIDEMNESIEDKKEFIAELEAEIADLDKRINQ